MLSFLWQSECLPTQAPEDCFLRRLRHRSCCQPHRSALWRLPSADSVAGKPGDSPQVRSPLGGGHVSTAVRGQGKQSRVARMCWEPPCPVLWSDKGRNINPERVSRGLCSVRGAWFLETKPLEFGLSRWSFHPIILLLESRWFHQIWESTSRVWEPEPRTQLSNHHT